MEVAEMKDTTSRKNGRTATSKSAVRDLPEPKPTRLSQRDLRVLREAGFKKLAKLAEPYAARKT